jgi:hypothetical protein
MKNEVVTVLLTLGYKAQRGFGGMTFTRGVYSVVLSEIVGEFVTMRISRTIQKRTDEVIGLLVTENGVGFLEGEHPALIEWGDTETISIMVALCDAMMNKKSPE